MITGPVRRGPRVAGSAVRRRVRDGGFLLEVEATAPGLVLAGWLGDHAAETRADLLRYGAVLFRGFETGGPAGFGLAARQVGAGLLDYLDRAAARTEVSEKVFTSTEYANDQWIPLHHEMSYAHSWPRRIYFYCDTVPATGGATPLAAERLVVPLIPLEIRDRFARDGVRYVRNYGAGLDLSWQEAFQTTQRSEVERYCASSGIEVRWTGSDDLRTTATRSATVDHPETGETVWFNHAHMFHVSNMPSEVADTLLSEFGAEGLPRNAFYGDGSPIDDEVAGLIRDLYRSNAVDPQWQAGDVLAVDNVLAAHGRAPFAGARRILVAMSDLHNPGGQR